MNITITDNAVRIILDSIESMEVKDPYLAFYVAGGGCSGLQYGLALSEGDVEIDDVVVFVNGIKVAIEQRSAKYVDGCEIDYVNTNEMTGGFKINNPNAQKGCGCGKSFSPDENDDISSLNNGAGCSSCSH
jgi:iron-sulfur cluster assembly protein